MGSLLVTTVVDIIGYRDWAQALAATVVAHYARGPVTEDRLTVHYHGSTLEACGAASLLYLVGWSDLVGHEFYEGRTVLVLHPSPLPLYRGGSPIQHQIIDGLDTSAVTLFRLDTQHMGVDAGPIAWQQAYSLDGDLADVLQHIAIIGAAGVIATIDAFRAGTLTYYEQTGVSSLRKRRTPAQSEITLLDLQTLTARQLHDRVRALQEPYPNAFIRTADRRRLYISRTHIGEDDDDEAAGDRATR